MGVKPWLALLLCFTSTASAVDLVAQMASLRVEDVPVELVQNGPLTIAPKVEGLVKLIGHHMNMVGSVMFTTSEAECRSDLGSPISSFQTQVADVLAFHMTFPEVEVTYHICLTSHPMDRAALNDSLEDAFLHQGSQPYRSVRVKIPSRHYMMPLPVQIVAIILLLMLSSLFSGLNLGLMTLNPTELQIISKSGTRHERRCAGVILPVRMRGNYLLCSILFGNVIVNSAISILFDDLTSGVIALVVSSLAIVLLGEILPQAVCSRYGLTVGAKTIHIMKAFMFLTAPLSWPTSKVLDAIFGVEMGVIYNRERLMEIIRLSKDAQKTDGANHPEVAIFTGALEMGSKTVKDVMTHLNDMFAIPITSVLDSSTVLSVVQTGFTRIPVYQGTPDNVVGLLNVKDMALLDPADAIPVSTVCQFYQHPVRHVLDDTPIAVMLEEFRKGQYHMAFIQRINAEGFGDPFYELIGLVTLEDIIEEIIQAEIIDESDVLTDNRGRVLRRGNACARRIKELSLFALDSEKEMAGKVNPQLAIATFQFLSTSIDAFHPRLISPNVLRRLVKQNVMEWRISRADTGEDNLKFLYNKDKPADYFVMILEGRVEVHMGADNFVFEAGPFFYFGRPVLDGMAELAPRLSNLSKSDATTGSLQSLQVTPESGSLSRKVSFVPDFTVRVSQDVSYLLIKSNTYLKAYRATLIEAEKSLKLTKSQAELRQSCSTPFIQRPIISFPSGPQLILTEPTDKPIGFVRPQSPESSPVKSSAVEPEETDENGEVDVDTPLVPPIKETLKVQSDESCADSLDVAVASYTDGPAVGRGNTSSPAESFVSMDFGRTSSEMTLEAAELNEMNAMVIEKRLNLVNRLRTETP